jgi:hypothetical protein
MEKLRFVIRALSALVVNVGWYRRPLLVRVRMRPVRWR